MDVLLAENAVGESERSIQDAAIINIVYTQICTRSKEVLCNNYINDALNRTQNHREFTQRIGKTAHKYISMVGR